MEELVSPANAIRAGWWTRQSLTLRMVLVALTATILVMGAMTALIAWQSRTAAVQSTQREMTAAMMSTEQSLQLVVQTASSRSKDLLPIMIDMLGGEPRLDGTSVPTGEAGDAPRLVAGGATLNGNIAPLETLQRQTGADAAILIRHGGRWVRATTLLRDANGKPRIGSPVDPADPLAAMLDAGKPATNLTQRNGKWYAISIQPLTDTNGTVYGGLSIRMDVHDQITALLDWMSTVSIAGHGKLGILRPAADGKSWLYASGPDAGKALDTQTSAMVNRLSRLPDGFLQTNIGPQATPSFVAWNAVDTLGWMLYSVGQRDDFLAASTKTLKVQLALMLGGMVLICGTIGWLARINLRPMRDVVNGMARMGQGNLTGHIPEVPSPSRNEVHLLLGNLKRTQENLADTILAVRNSVDQINVGSAEIAAGNTDLSSRTEEQAASLEETAASMEQLAGTVKQNADNARHASGLADDASGAAARGGSAVSHVVGTMQQISHSSRQIAEIVGVIDSIAFQTNILALNAAVEAARAGEQGKGFAVVASEVRALAQRSAAAAKEIKDLIGESVQRVDAGSQQVEHAGATMQEIVTAVQRVTAIMSEISAATEEQAAGIEQVNRAVAQMDETTQQNAALVEEAAAASSSLEDQAARLAQAVAVFRVKASDVIDMGTPAIAF